MRTTFLLLFVGVAIALVGAHPVDVSSQNGEQSSTRSGVLHRERRTIGILRDLFPNFSKENAVAESQVKEVRVKREAEAAAEEEASSEEQDTDATGDNEVADDNDAEGSELEDEEEEEEEEDPRNKRFLNFNLGVADGKDAGGSGGGSGNFLFDVIRLVAGSGQSHGEGHAALEEPKEGHYGEGVPGPLTRLFVVANKGVASLIQDLILRLAQTSERIVNFKARLITSII